jgi:transcription antitermination protein NusB
MSSSGSAKARRTAARLGAVQALYQLEMGDDSAKKAVYDLMQLRQDDLPQELVTPDDALLKAITEGVFTRLADIDALLTAALSASRSLERGEAILRAIFRAGAFELLSDGETAPGIIINDYVNVAHAFFTGAEPAKVNGVLNAVAQALGRGRDASLPPATTA